MLERLQIPRVHWNTKASLIPDSCKHKKLIVEYVENISANVCKPRGLLLFGTYSAGKSGCAAICLKAAAFRGCIGLWLVANSVPTVQIEKTPFDEEVTLYERACSVPLLVLDELQIRSEVKGIEQYVERLIRLRVDAKLATIITTNHTPAEVSAKFPALAAALLEAVVPMKVDGHDFRKEISNGLLKG